MPVLMTMRVAGDPKKLEEQGSKDAGGLNSITDSAKKHGLIAHRFYGSDDGQIMVVGRLGRLHPHAEEHRRGSGCMNCAANRAQPDVSTCEAPLQVSGWMFWFRWKRLPGS